MPNAAPDPALVDRFRADGQQRLVRRQLMEVSERVRTNLGVAKLERLLPSRLIDQRVGQRRGRRSRRTKAAIEARL